MLRLRENSAYIEELVFDEILDKSGEWQICNGNKVKDFGFCFLLKYFSADYEYYICESLTEQHYIFRVKKTPRKP